MRIPLKNISYAEAIQISPIVLQPNSSQTLLKQKINEKISQALEKMKLFKKMD